MEMFLHTKAEKITAVCLAVASFALVVYVLYQGYLPASLESTMMRVIVDVRRYQNEMGQDEAAFPAYDPFSPNHDRLRVDTKRKLVWSVGPDRLDDRGILIYDPTNGLKSKGDIVGTLSEYYIRYFFESRK